MVGKFSGPLTKQVLQIHTGSEEEKALDRSNSGPAGIETHSVANSEFREGDDPFLPVRRLANSSLLTHKQTLAVLAAVEDIIDETTKRRSPTSYFAALMTFLEQQKTVAPTAHDDPEAEDGEGHQDDMHEDASDDDDDENGNEHSMDYVVKGKKASSKNERQSRKNRKRALNKKGLAVSGHHGQHHHDHQQVQEQEQEQDLTTAIFQLLAIIFHRLSQAVLRTKFADISRIITGTLETHFEQPTLVRHALDCLAVALGAQDTATWALPVTQSIFRKVTAVTLDPRPKVRKIAQDSVTALLQNPKCASHTADVVGSFAIHTSRSLDLTDSQKVIHFVHLLKEIMPFLSSQHCEELVQQLIKIATSNQSYATMAVFQSLGAFFSKADGKMQPHILSQLLEEFQSVKPDGNDTQLIISWVKMQASGYKTLTRMDSDMCAKKLPTAVSSLMGVFASTQKPVIQETAASLQHLLENSITARTLAQTRVALTSKVPRKQRALTPLENLVTSLEAGLSPRYQSSWEEILGLIATLFEKLGPLSDPLLVGCLKTLDQIHQAADMVVPRERVEHALRAAAKAFGPVSLLRVLPLNIFGDGSPSSATATSVSRPYLLPLLKGNISKSQLAFFASAILPLSQQVLARSRQCQHQKQHTEAQNYHFIYLQLWGLFPGFCTLPTDTASAFPAMAKDLGMAINGNPEIRPTICAGLSTLIEQSLEVKAATEDKEATGKEQGSPLDFALATITLETVGKFAKNFLPILFNVYSSLSPDSRGYVLELVRSFFKITDQDLLMGFFGNAMKKVLALFNSTTTTTTTTTTEALTPAQVEEQHSLFDLLCAMAPHLGKESVLVLYRLVKTNWHNTDLAIQKKAYKAMAALLEAGHFGVTLGASQEDLQTLLLDANLSASSASKRQRLTCLTFVVAHLADDDLHLIPSFLPEVILGTKEPNEQARQAAFDLLLALARRMEKGGKINMEVFEEATGEEAHNNQGNDNVDDDAGEDDDSDGNDDDDDDDTGEEKRGKKDRAKRMKKILVKKHQKEVEKKIKGKKGQQGSVVEASLEEFVKMVIAGLAGTSQHMMSATMTCLARLVYEYLESLRFEIIEQIIASVLLLLHSKSRELIKSVLGFVKMIVVSLDPDDLGPFLPDIIEGILMWIGDHKNHFRLKVKHMMERLIKKFGVELITDLTPEEHQKLVLSIRKQKERAKKKGGKEEGAEEAEDELQQELREHRQAHEMKKTAANSAKGQQKQKFEELMNDSASEGEGAEDDDDADFLPAQLKEQLAGKLAAKKSKQGTWIKEEVGMDIDTHDNEPLDFLDRNAISRVVSTKPSEKKKRFAPATKYSDDGKMIIANEDEHQGVKEKSSTGGTKPGPAGSHKEVTLDDLIEEVGTQRLGRKRKFIEGEHDDDEEDDDGTDEQGGSRPFLKAKHGKGRPQQPRRLGEEYAAKKAGGDIKRKGRPDPFAYLPLNPASLNRRKRAKHQGEMHTLLKASPATSKKLKRQEGHDARKRHKGRS